MLLPERYSLAGESTEGGMGDIHLCKDEHLDRLVVLKLLKDEEESRRLLDEKKALLRLRSKHVVQLYDVIDAECNGQKKPGLVLECIAGKDLSSVTITEGHINILWQIACGLVDIHKEGLIHRDLKPENIRVADDGIVKILDFGLSRAEGEEAKTQSIIGTPIYMAPELWKRENIEFTQAIDVYAFGVTAISIIAKKIPKAFFERPPKPIPSDLVDQLCSELPKDIRGLLNGCLSYKYQERPSMVDVENSLRSHLLYNRHRALIVLNGKRHEMSSMSPKSTIKGSDGSSLTISYDGSRFVADDLSGAVSVNNIPISKDFTFPGSCVLSFGSTGRTFATLDISNPEVTS